METIRTMSGKIMEVCPVKFHAQAPLDQSGEDYALWIAALDLEANVMIYWYIMEKEKNK